MATSPAPDVIEYGLLQPDEVEPFTNLLAETFSRNDPPAYAVGITVEDFSAFVSLLLPQVLSEELTMVARLGSTRELVGALLAMDSASPLPQAMSRLSDRFDPIFDILGELEVEYRRGVAPKPGQCLHVFLLGVSGRVAGRGVGQQLVASCLEHGASRGYQLAITEATNKTSQHIFRKLGFTARVQRSYADHIFEGRHAFASIAQHGGPMLMDKRIAQ